MGGVSFEVLWVCFGFLVLCLFGFWWLGFLLKKEPLTNVHLKLVYLFWFPDLVGFVCFFTWLYSPQPKTKTLHLKLKY